MWHRTRSPPTFGVSPPHRGCAGFEGHVRIAHSQRDRLAALGAWPVAFRVRALLFDERHQCWILEVGSFGFCEHDGRLKDESAVLLFANEVPIVPTELA